jgi:hypothetical protein
VTMHMPAGEAVYTREGAFVVFNQLGVKHELDPAVPDADWYDWLDDMTARIGALVPGAEIAEKSYARTAPRLNTGVYYDTADRRLLGLGAVLRTTCNTQTHAFCAFKEPDDGHGVRRDHRYVFDGEEKATIQDAPASPAAAAIVARLLARTDVEHPGTHLRRRYGIAGEALTPSLCLEQYRHPFFVWLDGQDALRCSMDRAEVYDLRVAGDAAPRRATFGEVEFPVFPRIAPEIARDPRVLQLIDALSDALQARYDAPRTTDNKYQRAAKALRR